MGAHHHASPAHRWRLAVAFAITTAVLLAEVAGALITGSLALLVDAAHMLTDAGGLMMALLASTLMARPPTARRTWGFLRAEVLAALAQAAILLAVGLYAFIEGLQRLFAPPEVASGPLLLFGILGLAGNLASLAVLGSGRGANLNMRAAFLEVLNDALGSVAVIASALVIATTGWTQVDAIVSLLIAALIVPRALILLRDTIEVLMETTPKGLDLDEVRAGRPEADDLEVAEAARRSGADVYVTFFMQLILTFGISFVLPVLLVGLNMLGLLKGRTILRSWRWVVIIVLIISAMAAPGPDMMTMFYLAVPLLAHGLAWGSFGGRGKRRPSAITTTSASSRVPSWSTAVTPSPRSATSASWAPKR